MNDIVNKFTNHYRNALKLAYVFANLKNMEVIEPTHILWGLLAEEGCLANEILRKAGITLPDDHALSDASSSAYLKNDDHSFFKFPFSEASKHTIRASVAAASAHSHKYVGTEHLLFSLLAHQDKEIISLLKGKKNDLTTLRQQVTLVLKSTSRFPDLAHALTPPNTEEQDESGQGKKSKTPALDYFAVELTSPASQSRIDPLIGREKEIERIIQILSRKNKNNPILLGDPGVGKTALVEGLARRIYEGMVPDMLLRKRIYSLDLSMVVAGTVYRGEFESRIKQILDEAKSDHSLILFIDEIHTIIGAGSASGSLDAANILKPALARGELRCIGATTHEEYKRHLETDPALERRFQPVNVPEPSIEDTIAILKGVKSSYETHHRITLTDEALTAAAQLSARYLTDKRLPDKAIDLIDEASARARIASGSDTHIRQLKELETKLEEVKKEKEQAVRQENFPLALSHKESERALTDAIQKLTRSTTDAQSSTPVGTVTKDDIIAMLSHITGIPMGQLVDEERTRLLNLASLLRERVVGQDTVLHDIAGFIRRARTGLSGSDRPLGSFIFLGPSGVGKTETAKAIAEVVFHDPHALIRFDMSEFGESFQTAKLIGAPAGYVGYREGGKLTEMVRRRPYSVILLDEIEKAHPDVFNLFLSILDEGRLTDSTGKTIDFRNCIIIMTSNIGLHAFNAHATLGFESPTRDTTARDYERIKEHAMSELKERFRPEFLNRIDRIAIFQPLKAADMRAIATMQLTRLRATLAAQQVDLTWHPSVIPQLAETRTNPGDGARSLQKTIREKVENPIADALLHQNKTPIRAITLRVNKGNIIIDPATTAAASPRRTRSKRAIRP